MATTALGRLTLDLAVRMSEFSEGLGRAARETADRTNEMNDSVTEFKDNMLESLSGTPIGSAIDTLTEKLGSVSDAFGANGLAGATVVAGAAAAGAVVAIGAAVTAMIVEVAAADRQLEMLAKRADVSTKSLQVLTAAAKPLGFEMENVTDILADAKEKLGEFSATGGGGFVETLNLIKDSTGKTDAEINKMLDTVMSMETSDGIQYMYNEMEKAGVTTEESRFILESWASGLSDIESVYESNGSKLQQMEKDLEQYGVIRTEEAIANTKILSEEMANLDLTMEGYRNELITQSTPALIGFIEYLTKGTSKAGDMRTEIGLLGKSMSGLSVFTIGAISMFKSLGYSALAVGGVIGSFAALVYDLGSFNAIGAYDRFVERNEYFSGFADSVVKEMDKANEAMATAKLTPKQLADRENAFNMTDKEKQRRGLSNDGLSSANGSRSKYESDDAKEATKATKENTKALKDKTKKDKGIASQSLKEYVVGGKPYSTGKGGHYGAARAGRPLGHQGLDLSTGKGTQVYAPEAGKYTFANTPNSGTGRMAILEGDSGKKYRFLHMDSTSIASGSRVDMGDPIAKTGNSGVKKGGGKYDTHLHIEVFDSKGRRLDPTHMKVGGTAKQKVDLASNYDADNREAEQAQAKRDQAAEQARKEEAARKLAGQNAVDAALAQSAKIDLEAKKLVAEANRTLNDRPNDLATVLADIERNRVKAQKDLNDKVMKPFLTKEDEINLEYEDRIYESISAYGEGTALQIEASKNALADRDKDLAELREATLAPFRSERDQLGIELANDIKAVEALHGAGSDVAQQATDFLKAQYEIKIKELNYLAGETQRQIAILSQNIGLSTKQATDQLQDSIAKANMKPKDFELYSATKSWERGREGQQGAYEDREKEINAVDGKGDFLYEAEDRNKLLEEAHTEHLARMAVLDDEYANRTTTIAKDSARSKLEIEQTNVDAFGSLAGTLLGQQSSAAKAAFLLSKAYTVQRILLDKGAAMSSAYAEAKGGVFAKAMAAAKAGLENGLISDMVNQVAMPTFTGIAHGGLDYVPSESTYLLDKGERVLSPKQNKDLTGFLANTSKSSNGDTNITITIDNNGNANMNSDNASEVSKNLSLQIRNIVEATLRKEKRQGGML